MTVEVLTRTHELFPTAGQRHSLTLRMVKDEHPLELNLLLLYLLDRQVAHHCVGLWQTFHLSEDELQKGRRWRTGFLRGGRQHPVSRKNQNLLGIPEG